MTTTTKSDTTNTHAASSAAPIRAPKRKQPQWPGFPGARPGETVGGGYFIFKRGGRTGRIKAGCAATSGVPFEHGSLREALAEAARLQKKYGGTFQVFAMEAEAMPLCADNDDWDFDPRRAAARSADQRRAATGAA